MCQQEIYITRIPRPVSPTRSCRPDCIYWTQCNALGVLEYMYIVIDKNEEVEEWCQSLCLQNPQNIEEESQKE